MHSLPFLQSHRIRTCGALALRSLPKLLETRSRWPPLPSERPHSSSRPVGAPSPRACARSPT
eukprot:2012844-Pleurochrysis_carterae.AAC.1